METQRNDESKAMLFFRLGVKTGWGFFRSWVCCLKLCLFRKSDKHLRQSEHWCCLFSYSSCSLISPFTGSWTYSSHWAWGQKYFGVPLNLRGQLCHGNQNQLKGFFSCINKVKLRVKLLSWSNALIIHSFNFNNRFVLVTVAVDPESIPETLGVRWEYSLEEHCAVH